MATASDTESFWPASCCYGSHLYGADARCKDALPFVDIIKMDTGLETINELETEMGRLSLNDMMMVEVYKDRLPISFLVLIIYSIQRVLAQTPLP